MRRVSTERVPEVQRYVVRGSHPLPVDMLRHDRCWPASERDSEVIAQTWRHENNGPVEVEICTRSELTVGRWESYGWHVIAGPRTAS